MDGFLLVSTIQRGNGDLKYESKEDGELYSLFILTNSWCDDIVNRFEWIRTGCWQNEVA